MLDGIVIVWVVLVGVWCLLSRWGGFGEFVLGGFVIGFGGFGFWVVGCGGWL